VALEIHVTASLDQRADTQRLLALLFTPTPEPPGGKLESALLSFCLTSVVVRFSFLFFFFYCEFLGDEDHELGQDYQLPEQQRMKILELLDSELPFLCLPWLLLTLGLSYGLSFTGSRQVET